MLKANIVSKVPKDKTLKELVLEVGNISCNYNRFIEMNKFSMVQMGAMDDFDYGIFWDCMRVYEAYGNNYFGYYYLFCTGYYGDFTYGLEAWCESDSPRGYRLDIGYRNNAEDFFELVDVMRFFNVSSYCGIDFSEYENACQWIYGLERKVRDNEMRHRNEKRKKTIAERMENYFNFDNYSEEEFEELSRSLIEEQKKSIAINEALALAHSVPQNTYIVILKKDNNICHIGKTKQLLSYLGMNQKKYEADSAYFEIVDADYIDDLIISMKVLYDVEIDKIRPSKLNRKYATDKRAIFAYNYSEGIPIKVIKSAIQNQELHAVVLANGQVLIDKIALHRALYPN